MNDETMKMLSELPPSETPTGPWKAWHYSDGAQTPATFVQDAQGRRHWVLPENAADALNARDRARAALAAAESRLAAVAEALATITTGGDLFALPARIQSALTAPLLTVKPQTEPDDEGAMTRRYLQRLIETASPRTAAAARQVLAEELAVKPQEGDTE